MWIANLIVKDSHFPNHLRLYFVRMIRIVVMSFKEGQGTEFRKLFDGWKDSIASFPGCEHLRLVQDIHDPDVYMTISTWRGPEDLDAYRHSDLFAKVWPTVKPMFREKACAWSVESDWESAS